MSLIPRNDEKMDFRRIGGSWQLVIDNAEDIRHAIELNATQWAITSIPLDSVMCDREFLEFIDDDNNGRIRVDEVKRSAAWTLRLLKDYTGLNNASTTLLFSAVNTDDPEGMSIINSAKVAMENLGKRNAIEITLADIRNHKQIIADGLQNGDGVIPPELISDQGLAGFAKDIMTVSGKKSDAGGTDGVDMELLDSFMKNADAFVKWHRESAIPEGNISSAIMPFGKDTHEVCDLFTPVNVKIDDFFNACAALRMSSANPLPRASAPDFMDTEGMNKYLANAVICEPSVGCVLDFNANLNPFWNDVLQAFAAKVLPLIGITDGRLDFESWRKLKKTLQPFIDWKARKPTTLFDKMDVAAVEKHVGGDYAARLRVMIEKDIDVGREIKLFNSVRRLILNQAYLLHFLNNYACLKSLFDPGEVSMLQCGKLVMDGRVFTLNTKVSDIAEHKKLAARSEICVMYLALSTGPKDAVKTMNLAVAVTAGHMRNLFIGKSGVFFTPDGIAWDAKVIDFIQQPVSVSEAMKMPFFKFGEFIGKQADKFFSAKSKEIETTLDKTIQKGIVPPAGTAPAPAAAPAQPTQSPAFSGSMVLMGGGVGIAAIGSSIAFIAQAIKNVSFLNVVGVFLGVILLFSAPVIIVSLVKLYRRNVASFLEAGSWALNSQMRLTRQMGIIFTHKPKMPISSILRHEDLVKAFITKNGLAEKLGAHRIVLRILIGILLVLILAGALFGPRIYRHFYGTEKAAVSAKQDAVPDVPKQEVPPTPEPAK